MKQFFSEENNPFKDLEKKAQNACVTFPNQELPPGCSPTHAKIGFEIAPTGESILYVEKGVTYAGTNNEILMWLSGGAKTFPDFNALKAWIIGPLAETYSQNHLAYQALTKGSLPLVHSKEEIFRLTDKQTDLNNN
jgi:hypothetical protein